MDSPAKQLVCFLFYLSGLLLVGTIAFMRMM